MPRIILASGILRRDDDILLVHCRYPGQREPLWTLPGGRAEAGEMLAQAVVREFLEETSLTVRVRDLAYVSESNDSKRDLQVFNCTFWVDEAKPWGAVSANDPSVVEASFIPMLQAPDQLAADVLRVPVAAALAGGQPRYFQFRESDIKVPFFRTP